jgi:hypothetical protein
MTVVESEFENVRAMGFSNQNPDGPTTAGAPRLERLIGQRTPTEL